MKYTEMYADAGGETHFRDVEVAMSLIDLAPPSAPMNASEFRAAKEVAFIHLPPGWAAAGTRRRA